MRNENDSAVVVVSFVVVYGDDAIDDDYDDDDVADNNAGVADGHYNDKTHHNMYQTPDLWVNTLSYKTLDAIFQPYASNTQPP